MKPLSQQSLAIYSLFYQETTLENKGTQIASMKCGSLKSGIGEANSRCGCLSRGSVSHKGTPTSMLLKHSLRVSLLGNQVSSVDKTTVTLILISTKELLHKGWGSPRPPHKNRSCRSTPNRRIVDVAGEPQSSKVPVHQDFFLVHKRTTAQGLKALLYHSLRANLYTTLSKCAKE